MKTTFRFISAALGLLALLPTESKAHGFGFEVSVGPSCYEGGHCAPGYGENQPLTITIDPLTTAVTTIAQHMLRFIAKDPTIVAIAATTGTTRIACNRGLLWV